MFGISGRLRLGRDMGMKTTQDGRVGFRGHLLWLWLLICHSFQPPLPTAWTPPQNHDRLCTGSGKGSNCSLGERDTLFQSGPVAKTPPGICSVNEVRLRISFEK